MLATTNKLVAVWKEKLTTVAEGQRQSGGQNRAEMERKVPAVPAKFVDWDGNCWVWSQGTTEYLPLTCRQGRRR